MKSKIIFKKSLSLILTFILFISITLPNSFAEKIQLTDDQLLDLESKKCFDFFWNEATVDINSPGYGLIRDKAPYENTKHISSISSVGFGLTAYVIGAERGWVTYQDAYDRTLGTLNTLLNNVDQVNGFFYHFVNMDTAKREWNCEVSIIDTAITVNGALTAGEYFGGEIKDKAQQLYERIDWEWYRDKDKNQFYMGYSPEKGFAGHWDFYGEQLMLYFLSAASPTHPVNTDMFYDFIRDYKSYGNYPEFIHSWFGSLFTHQFSYAWFDMRNKVDKEGVNWWKNSVIASKSSRQFSIDNNSKFNTLGTNSWGLTACDGPKGYSGYYGSAPSGYNNDQHIIDGTIPPAGAAGSIVFTPTASISALQNYYNNYPELWGNYGFKDAYNIDTTPAWYSKDVIGIDKGITLLMIENYRTGLIWKLFMKNKYVQSGMRKVKLTDIGKLIIDDFEGNKIHNGWQDGGDSVYDLTEVNSKSNTGLKSLEVKYDKQTFSWPCFKIDVNNLDLSKTKSLKAKIYGNTKILIKFVSQKGCQEKTFTLNGGNSWQDIEWNFSEITDKNTLTNIQQILFFVDPGDVSTSGTFYIDDIEILYEKILASNVFIDGKPVINQTLVGTYDYYNADGKTEGQSTYRWLRSSSSNGTFEPIQGAVGKTYIVAQEDIGKFIKFEVTPKADSPEENAIGRPTLSKVFGPINTDLPQAKNVTITKEPVIVERFVDDCDGQKIGNDWIDSGDNVYTLSTENCSVNDEKSALKIKYNKNGFEWAFFQKIFNTSQDFSNSTIFSANIYGNPKMLFKFETYDEVNSTWQGLCEKWVDPGKEQWNTFTWDISPYNNNLNKVKRILVFVEPTGQNSKTSSGTFYMDDIKFIEKSITNVTTTGNPIVGEKLIGHYDYIDANGDIESNSVYKWLKADTKDGFYTPISGAKYNFYMPTLNDIGKFLKFEVIPKTTAEPSTGLPVQSLPSNAIQENPSGVPPEAVNVSIKKETFSEKTFDNFNGTCLNNKKWADNGDGVYIINTENANTFDNKNALRIDYNKNGHEWSYFSTNINNTADFTTSSVMNIKVYGTVDILLKLETSSNGSFEKEFSLTGVETWQEIHWDITDIRNKLADVNRLLIFVAPGKSQGQGTFYLDDIKLIERHEKTTPEITRVFDNFNNTGWIDNDGGIYKISLDDNITKDKSMALKVKYNKNQNHTWAYIYTNIDQPKYFEKSNILKANICGDEGKLLLKLESSKGSCEQWVNLDGKDNWKDISWNISQINDKCNSDMRFLIFAQPNVTSSSGMFIIDNIKLLSNEINIGETLTGYYEYKDMDGDKESGSTYKWFKSSSLDGKYTEINGAISKTYTVTEKDKGMFLKFEVTPKNTNLPSVGPSVLSPAVKVEGIAEDTDGDSGNTDDDDNPKNTNNNTEKTNNDTPNTNKNIISASNKDDEKTNQLIKLLDANNINNLDKTSELLDQIGNKNISSNMAKKVLNHALAKIDTPNDHIINSISKILNKVGQINNVSTKIKGSNKIVKIYNSEIKRALEKTEKAINNTVNKLEAKGYKKVAEKIKPNATVTIYANNINQKDSTDILLPSNAISEINKKGIGIKFIANDVEIKLSPNTIDTSLLKDIKQIKLSKKQFDKYTSEKILKKVTVKNNYLNPISKIYNFNLYGINSKGKDININNFNGKMKIKIKMDKKDLNSIKNIEKVGVYYVDNNGNIEFKSGTFSKDGIIFETNHFSNYVIMECNKTFEDISNHWAKPYIEILAAKNITNGIDNIHFQPESNITRAQFAVFIAKALGFNQTTYNNKFTDVDKTKYYTGYISALTKIGLLNGYPDHTFKPDNEISREEMITLIMKTYKYIKKENLKDIKGFNTSNFTDINDAASFSVDSIKSAKALNLIQGVGKNEFHPKDSATRAEVAKILVEFLKKIK